MKLVLLFVGPECVIRSQPCHLIFRGIAAFTRRYFAAAGPSGGPKFAAR
jgi:hypothetical protein